MTDLKLFKLTPGEVLELPGEAVQLEKSLQTVFERNLEAPLGVRFLASEHQTGALHGGRIDTLGLDENGSPVIIEYKKSVDQNVINQGLFYLDWLLDHRKEYEWLVMKTLGQSPAEAVDWSAPRLLCIAGNFTKYDVNAVRQISRNIELLRYRRFTGDLLLLELLHAPKQLSRSNAGATVATTSHPTGVANSPDSRDRYQSQRMAYRLASADADLSDLYGLVRDLCLGLGDDVQLKETEFYHAMKRIKNFACLEVYPQTRTVVCHLRLDPKTVSLDSGFTRDMTGVGHFGTGDLQVTIRTAEEFARSQPLLRAAYEAS